MHKKKYVRFLHLFSKKPQKNLHLKQNFIEKGLIKFLQTCWKNQTKICILRKNSELIFAHVFKITNLFVEKTFDFK